MAENAPNAVCQFCQCEFRDIEYFSSQSSIESDRSLLFQLRQDQLVPICSIAVPSSQQQQQQQELTHATPSSSVADAQMWQVQLFSSGRSVAL